MKSSFSTLGCPNWTLPEIFAAAKDLGYNGIELRGLGEDIYLPHARMLQAENCHRVRTMLKENGLSISCISTDCTLQIPDGNVMDEAKAYIDLAARLGAPYIRLLGDTAPAPADNVDVDLVAARLRELAPLAQAQNVTLLLESNGVFSDTALLRDTVLATKSDAVAVLWDINHPVRYAGEEPGKSYENIGSLVRHVHIKDTAIENGKIVYKMLGYGSLPLKEALSLLKAADYSGFLSLEWTKRWNQELEDAGIVFAHFMFALGRLWKNA